MRTMGMFDKENKIDVKVSRIIVRWKEAQSQVPVISRAFRWEFSPNHTAAPERPKEKLPLYLVSSN